MNQLHLVTLGELLVSGSAEVRRHAQGCLKAIEKDMDRIRFEQDQYLSGAVSAGITPRLRACPKCRAGNMPVRATCRSCNARLHL